MYLRRDLRRDLFEEQKRYINEVKGLSGLAYCERFISFMAPFVPQYVDENYVNTYWKGKKFPQDFSHEREWRLPGSLLDFDSKQGGTS